MDYKTIVLVLIQEHFTADWLARYVLIFDLTHKYLLVIIFFLWRTNEL